VGKKEKIKKQFIGDFKTFLCGKKSAEVFSTLKKQYTDRQKKKGDCARDKYQLFVKGMKSRNSNKA